MFRTGTATPSDMSSYHEDDVPSVFEYRASEAATATVTATATSTTPASTPASTSASTSQGKEPERKVQKVFDEYNDPGADVILAFNDGDLFRVHSYILKASSSMFRDMFKIAKSDRGMQGTRPSQQQSEQQERETETIHIDASSNVLAMFLDMMQSDPVPTNLDDGVLEAIATLADKYGCEVVIERVLLRASGSNPWEVFRLAVRYDYPQIAKLALTLMYREKDEARKTMSTTSLQLEWLVGIPLNYLVGLVSALGRWEHYEIQSRVYRTSVQGHHPHSRQLSIPFYSLSSAEQVGEYFEPMNRDRQTYSQHDRLFRKDRDSHGRWRHEAS